jgi:hypothetical protein
MPIPLQWRVTLRVNGLAQSKKILNESLVAGLEGLGKLLVRSVRPRMREFSGKERRDVTYRVTGKGLGLSLIVFGRLVQTFIDELGLKPGTFPPWGVNSLLYKYVRRKGLNEHRNREEHHNFGVQRARRRISHVRSRSPQRASLGSGAGRVGPLARPAKPIAKGDKQAIRARNSSARARAKANSIRRVSFLVARAIFERGIKPGGPFRRTLEANRAQIVAQIRFAFQRAVARINRG